LASELRAVLAAVPVSGPAQAPSALAAAVMGTHLDVRALAARFAVSREVVIRRFARETGLTPHAFRLNARLNIARRLLPAGVAPAEAAALAGFADQSHLGRRFGAAFGSTPGQYRDHQHQPENITFVPDTPRQARQDQRRGTAGPPSSGSPRGRH
jgi:AraC-like DNA-binding protein